MEKSKKITTIVISAVILFVVSTAVVAVVKPKLHQTFNIQKLIIKKEVKN